MKKNTLLIAICGCKNSGKTTLITKLILNLCSLGYKVATIKHDGHDFQGDNIGTDTFKHKQAGAYGTALISNTKFMVIKDEKNIDENRIINLFPEADIILLEGFKNSDYLKFEILRKGNSYELVSNEKNLIGILSDIEEISYKYSQYEVIDLNNTELIVEEILKYKHI